MEVWAEKTYHIEQPVSNRPKTGEAIGRKPMAEMTPDELTWRSLIVNGLCLGMDSPCVTGKCEVMCGYGRRYLAEKDKHAG